MTIKCTKELLPKRFFYDNVIAQKKHAGYMWNVTQSQETFIHCMVNYNSLEPHVLDLNWNTN